MRCSLGCHRGKTTPCTIGFAIDKKIGHPLSSELAIGSVGLQECILTIHMDADPKYIERETDRLRQELKEQYRKFRGDRVPTPREGKTAIIVDDSIATGSTVLAGIKILRKRNAARIALAVPVAPPEAAENIKRAVDALVCLETPANFRGVGQFYQSFDEVTNEEVEMILIDDNS